MTSKTRTLLHRFVMSAPALVCVVMMGSPMSTSAQTAEPSHGTAEAASAPMTLKGAYTGAMSGTSAAEDYVSLNPVTRKDSGAKQTIELHGHWTINVSNPAGTLVQHREFENQLQYDGTQYLTGLISGYGVGGDYAIYFTNATAQATSSPTTNVVCPAPASTTTSTFPYCSIVQSTTSQPGSFHCLHYVCVSGLTVTPTFGSGTGLPNVVLAGMITAPQAGAIVNVYVGFNGCNISSTATPPTPTSAATISAAACETQTTGSYGGTMSGTTLGTPVTVVAGQIIQITVTYTFS